MRKKVMENYVLTICLIALLIIIVLAVYFWELLTLQILQRLSFVKTDQPVKILKINRGNSIDLVAIVGRYDKVILEMNVTGKNILIPSKVIKPITLLAGKYTPITTIVPTNSKFSYSYNFRYWQPPTKEPIQQHTYRLPYRTGESYKISQAFNEGTHNKPNFQYAVDFKMNEGTIICASREGVVAGFWDASDINGSSDEFRPYSNYILIRHNDGTYAQYAHLMHDGVLVSVSDHVTEGQPIALSGNTGMSKAPHLHFSIFTISETGFFKTIPFKFKTLAGLSYTPRSGDYTSHPGEQ